MVLYGRTLAVALVAIRDSHVYCTGVPLRSPWSLYTIANKRLLAGTGDHFRLILQVQIDHHVAVLLLQLSPDVEDDGQQENDT